MDGKESEGVFKIMTNIYRGSKHLYLTVSIFVFCCMVFSNDGNAKDEVVLLSSGKQLKGNLVSRLDGLIIKRKSKEKTVKWSEVDWIIIKRKDFTVMSRILPERTRYFAEAFEHFSRHMNDTFKFERPNLKNWSVRIRIFRDLKKMQQYEEMSSGDVSGGCGYFWVDTNCKIEELVIFDDPRDPIETLDTLLHEGTHFILHLWGKVKGFDFPVWIDEGMAEYFGGSVYEQIKGKKKMTFTQGVVKSERFLDIQERIIGKTAMPLSELFLMGHDKFDTEHYGQAWSVVHFIANSEKGKRAPLLYKYCYELRRTVREGRRAVDLFKKIMRVDIDDLEKDWQKYVVNLEPKSDFGRLALSKSWLWRGETKIALSLLAELDGGEGEDVRAAVIQAESLAWHYKYAEALDILEWALEKETGYMPAIKAKANISYEGSHWEDAMNCYEIYLYRNPYDLIADIKYIRCLIEPKNEFRNVEKSIVFGRKVEDYHNDAELKLVLGEAYMCNNDKENAVKCLEEAINLKPERAELVDEINGLLDMAKR